MGSPCQKAVFVCAVITSPRGSPYRLPMLSEIPFFSVKTEILAQNFFDTPNYLMKLATFAPSFMSFTNVDLGSFFTCSYQSVRVSMNSNMRPIRALMSSGVS